MIENNNSAALIDVLSSDKILPFAKFLDDPNIINVGWTGSDLWVEDVNLKKIHIPNDEHTITPQFINKFVTNVRNSKENGKFSKESPVLEAETDKYRIECLHESVSSSGNIVLIRKITETPRLNYENMIKDGYCEKEVLNFLINACYARKRIIIGGEPGVGKTELGKYLSLYIPNSERVVTIEDQFEFHYRELKPSADGIALRITKNFGYAEALKSCLRLDVNRVIMSEVRGVEVRQLIELWNSGASGITSLHTDDSRKIADRILSMMPTRLDAERLENSVYENLDIGILLNRKYQTDAEGNIIFTEWKRYIEQICLYVRENGKNKQYLIVENGKLQTKNLPKEYLHTQEKYKIEDMFVLNERVKRSGYFE